MKRKLAELILCMLVMFWILPVAASADIGPKPSVRISFENMGDEVCYGTLISRYGTGPYPAWDGDPERFRDYGDQPEIWEAFASYEDPDGYRFLQFYVLCSESKTLNWTYYPPQNFKILLYYPEENQFEVSGIYDRYAFDSYFTVNLQDLHLENGSDLLIARSSYHYWPEVVSFLCRAAGTILLELGIAWLFRLRSREQIRVILLVNLVTQIGLNVLLNLVGFYRGPWAQIAAYVLLEIIVFAVEAGIYTHCFRRNPAHPVTAGKCIGYALAANLGSFLVGRWISIWVPMLF